MNKASLALTVLLLAVFPLLSHGQNTELWQSGISLIPYPQQVETGGQDFLFYGQISITTDKPAADEIAFAATELGLILGEEFSVNASSGVAAPLVRLTISDAPSEVGGQGYVLETFADSVLIRANTAQGLFYGVQTLAQLIQPARDGWMVRGVKITDWPDIDQRAVHYDTKHFHENAEYVRSFIRTLSRYKINMLIWEWEDHFAYQSHPDIGAPGAFTPDQMREFTSYARQYHIQIVPLIQGLGHVSYIQKHPRYRDLREIESSNWQHNALDERVYELMFDLWDEAIEATPGSEYLHIGTDETWELGRGKTSAEAEKIGRYGLLQHFIHRASEHLASKGRKVMSWGGTYNPREKIQPPPGLITFGWLGLEREQAVVDAGWPLYIYDPNPGIEHMFLPYFYRLRGGREVPGCLEQSYKTMSLSAESGIFDGMVATSWNCSGVHNQGWMLRYIIAAEYSWSGDNPGFGEFTDKFFVNYYGTKSRDVRELYELLNRASYFYMDSFERKVWHWGEVGKTHLPDLPRDDLEYDPYWKTEYADRLTASRTMLSRMQRAKNICATNLNLGAKQPYDFELFANLAELFEHTANTYLALGRLEDAIKAAHEAHFTNPAGAYASLENAAGIVEANLEERQRVYDDFAAVWSKSQIPKGYSTPEKKYVHGRDRQRNFANRRADYSFIIYDEQLLGLEDYLAKLLEYMAWYRENCL